MRMTTRQRLFRASAAVVTSLLLTPSLLLAEEDHGLDALTAQELGTVEESDQPIVIELAQGIDLLTQQITSQQELLKTAQTEREQQLIRNHIRLLQKERRSLEGLLDKLVGPDIDILEAAREQQAEYRSQQDEKRLETEDRLPQQ